MMTTGKSGRGIVEILGSGTSTGVPTMGCNCARCRSADPRDKRLRVSILIRANGKNILVDTTPDLRAQYLRIGQPEIDAIIYTHHHFDHIGGFDDVRGLNFRSRRPIDIYGMPETLDEIRRFFAYAFSSQESQSSSPTVTPHEVDIARKFTTAGIEWTPLLLRHGSMNVLGLRTGDFAYCTDCSEVPEKAKRDLHRVTNLVIDGLRSRVHPMHMTISEASRVIKEVGAQRGWLTHIAHETSQRDGTGMTPGNVGIACDGLKIPISVTLGKNST